MFPLIAAVLAVALSTTNPTSVKKLGCDTFSVIALET